MRKKRRLSGSILHLRCQASGILTPLRRVFVSQFLEGGCRIFLLETSRSRRTYCGWLWRYLRSRRAGQTAFDGRRPLVYSGGRKDSPRPGDSGVRRIASAHDSRPIHRSRDLHQHRQASRATTALSSPSGSWAIGAATCDAGEFAIVGDLFGIIAFFSASSGAGSSEPSSCSRIGPTGSS